jgi:CBS domain-containing protein
MATAREFMHPDAECIDENGTLNTAARMMRDLHVGSLPICGADGQLRSITDRDLAVHRMAEDGARRTVTAGQLARGTPVCADADVDVCEVLMLMKQHAIRGLPVLDDDRLVGGISEADLATHLGEHEVAESPARSTRPHRTPDRLPTS